MPLSEDATLKNGILFYSRNEQLEVKWSRFLSTCAISFVDYPRHNNFYYLLNEENSTTLCHTERKQ